MHLTLEVRLFQPFISAVYAGEDLSQFYQLSSLQGAGLVGVGGIFVFGLIRACILIFHKFFDNEKIDDRAQI